MLDEKDQQRLNDYLTRIENNLREISVSDRSDILLELDSHIKESLSSGEQTLDQVLKALGDPVLVANRYLLAKGVKPIPPRNYTWLKAFGLGSLAVFSLFIVAVVLLLKSISPILSVNEEEGRVVILGGLIDVNEKDGKVSLGKGLIKIEDEDMKLEFNSFEQKIAGDVPIVKQNKIVVTGQNGKWSFEPSDRKVLDYKCKVGGVGENFAQDQIVTTTSNGKEIIVNLGTNILTGAKCKFLVPKELEISADLGNGKINLENLQQNVLAKLNNGKIKFERSPNVAYNFKTNVTSGKVKGLNSMAYDKKGFNVDLKVVNGKIEVE